MLCSALSRLANDLFALDETAFTKAEVISASRRLLVLMRSLSDLGIERFLLADQIGLINRVLFGRRRFRFRDGDRGQSFSLTGTLVNTGGNCLGLTTVYTVIGRGFDIPLRPVLYEGHVAVGAMIGNETDLVDVSRCGVFGRRRPLTTVNGTCGNGRILLDQELLAVQLSNYAAFVCVPRDNYVKAFSLLEECLELFPGYVGGWINLAALHIRLGDSDGATFALERVFDLSPSGTYLRHAIRIVEQIATARDPARFHVY